MRHEKFLRKGLLVPLFLLMMLGLLPYGDVAPTHGETAQVVEQPTCILTPDLLGGQGFSVSGLGFSVSGLGFSVSGLGFSVSGLGFSVSGLGIDPAQVAQEIRNNPISAAWLDELLPDIEGGADYNTTKTALLVIDDFSKPNAHGNQVLAVFDELATVVDMTNILIVPIDVSGPNVAYETSRITGLIRSTIEGPSDVYGEGGLVGMGYSHFVLNLSFGLVPCDDPGPMIGGMQMPPFNFGNGLQAVTEANEPSEPEAVHPVLECVVEHDDHEFTAYFGYENENDASVTIPIGDDNFFTQSHHEDDDDDYEGYGEISSYGWKKDRGQPRLFETGRQEFAFSVDFWSGKTLEWTLEGPDGSTEAVEANAYSTPCGEGEVPPSHPHEEITPTLQCVADLGDGLYEARFGYDNANEASVTIPVGYKNKFSPSPHDRGQTFTFLPGSHEDVFRVEFYDYGGGEYEAESYSSSDDLEWKLKGPNYQWRSVTASSMSEPCFDDLSFGMDDYLEGLGVPEDMVDEYFHYLSDSIDDDDQLEDLRGLLQEYLAESASSNGAFTVIPVASAGNFLPWLGSAPLAPARWPEMIGVSATLGNHGPQWQFAQFGNVTAPGAGFPLTPTTFVAGTSFAAPYVSMVSALWLTYPDACVFDGAHPPLESFALPKDTNALFPVGGPSPLSCYLNQAPEVEQPEDQVSNEGETVELQIVAYDPDEDPLTYNASGLPDGLSIDENGLISGSLDYDASGNYTVSVEVSDGTATTEVEFMWTVVDVPQTAQCFATEVVSYVAGTKKNGHSLNGHNDPEEALGAPQNDDSSNYVALGFGNQHSTGVIVLGFAPSVIVNDNGHAPDLRVWETTNYHHHHWITYPERVKVEASQDGEHWVYLGITTRDDQAYDLKSLEWASYVRLTDVSNRHNWRFNSHADGFDVDAVEGFECATEDEEPPMVAVPGQWVESNDPLVSTDGWWGSIHTWQASGGSYQYTIGDHSEMSLQFIGTSIKVVYPKYPGLGAFTVFIDNEAVRTIVQHSWHSDFQRQATFAYLEDGIHTIEIVPIGGVTVIDAFYVPD